MEAVHGGQIADVGLLDLVLECPRPDRVGAEDVVIDPGVALEGVPRLELLGPPAEPDAEVVVAVLLLGGDVAHHHRVAVRGVLVEMDRAVLDRDDTVGVGVLAVLLEERGPAGQVAAVEQGGGALSWLCAGGAAAGPAGRGGGRGGSPRAPCRGPAPGRARPAATARAA